jgi:pyruvate ferredoxin oxidoreductase alpha subunit
MILIAYRVSENEKVLLPSMVCFDGFFLSHLSERVDVPELNCIKDFLPELRPKYPTLDIENPKVINVMAFPEFFEEFEFDKHYSMQSSKKVINESFEDFWGISGRKYGLIETYQTETAEMVLVGMGSMMGTALEAVKRLRKKGVEIGLVNIRVYNPFPFQEIVDAVKDTAIVGVMDRDISYGSGGIVFQNVLLGLYNKPNPPPVLNFIVGLGGRDVTLGTIEKIVGTMEKVRLEDRVEKDIIWPDLNTELIKAWKIGD